MELVGGEVLLEELGGVVGGGVVDELDFELGLGEAVGEDFFEAVDEDGAAVVGGDADGDEWARGHGGIIG